MASALRRRRGVTILEVIIVLTITMILGGLAVTSIQLLRESGARTTCQYHLKNLALTVHGYHDLHKKMPPYASGRPHEMYGGWFMHLLPYVSQSSLYNEIATGQSATDSNGIQIFTTGQDLPAVRDAVFAELACPTDPTRNANSLDRTSYLANWYSFTDGGLGPYRPAQPFSSLTDGLSHIVLFAEAYSECDGLPRLALYSSNFHNFGITQDGLPSDDPYYAPKDYTMFQVRPEKCEPWRTQTAHKAMNVAFADCCVRTVNDAIPHDTWKALLKPRDGAVHGCDW